jgi:hypothetical protein
VTILEAVRPIFSFRAGLGVAAVLACGVSACGSAHPSSPQAQRYLNTSRVASAIEQSTLSQRGLHARAYCPSEVPQIKDQRFTCIAYAPRVAPAIFEVVQLDAEGHVRYVAQ